MRGWENELFYGWSSSVPLPTLTGGSYEDTTEKIRLAALSILLYNLILILSIWLGKVSSKEEFMIAVAGMQS